MDPFKVFPHIVWQAILERVDSYADRMVIIRSHSTLEKLFESKINEWHLAAVIPIIVKSVNAPEFILLVESQLKPLRLAAKTICKVVDKSIEYRWDNIANAPINLYSCVRKGRGEFVMGYNVRRFIRLFGDYPPNRSPLVVPIMLFEVPFSYEALPDVTEEERIEVVRKAGPHLKGLRLELDMHHRPEDSIERSRVLVELILSLTPNLVHLSFPGFRRFLLINDETLTQELQRTAKLNLPELPFLRYLRIGIKAKPALVDFLGLEKYFPQLTRLTLMWDHWKGEYSSRAADVFPNLEYLSFLAPQHLGYMKPSYSRASNLPEFRTRLINIYQMQAPKIKRLYFEIIHDNKVVLKSIIRVETRNGLTYLRKRFEGECNWKCKIHAQLHNSWRYSLFRTNKMDTDGSDFPDDTLEQMIKNAIMEEENAVRQQELNELRIKNEERIINIERLQNQIKQQKLDLEMIQWREEKIRIQYELDKLKMKKEEFKTVEEEVKGDSCVKTVLKFASATAILGVLLANRIDSPVIFGIPILVAAAAGLYNLR